MSLVQMSVSGTVMILFTVIIRSLLIHNIPKRTFPVLWCIILVRLLIPFSLPCAISAYSFLTRNAAAEEITQNVTAPPLPDFFTGSAPDIPAAPANAPSTTPSAVPAVWLTGVLLCFVFFAVSYFKCHMKFRESLPADNEYVNRWLAEHRIFRRISVRCSDRISSPLTYGVFRPVILLPKNFGRLGNDELKFVLTHEYVHIRSFDAVFKFALIAALCVHWFNPLVWVMFIIANRDIEISCDESVIRMLGDCEKQTYAMTLISMEERKSGLFPLNSNFSKNAIKERIVAIMKFKKASALTVIASACLVACTTTVFATSAQVQNDNVSPSETTSAAGETSVDPVGVTKTDDADKSKAESVVSTAPDSVSETKTPADKASDEAMLSNEDELFVIGLETPLDGESFKIVCADGIPRFFPYPGKQWHCTMETYIDENDNVVMRFIRVEDE